MLDDLLELTTTLVHPSHEPTISNITGPSYTSEVMAPRSRHTKSSSVGSSSGTVDAVNGAVAGSPASKPASPAVASATPPTTTRRRRQSRSAASPPSSPLVGGPKPASRAMTHHSSHQKPTGAALKKFEPLKFATTIVLSTVLEAGLHTAASMSGLQAGDLAAVSKRPETWTEIVGLLGWKVAKLGIYWFSNFDAYDVASLSLLLSTPLTLLLGLFYQISPLTLTVTTLSSILANSLPYFFLRPISPSHTPNSAPKSSLRNRPILTDPYTTIATSLLATAIFAVLLEASFATFLPEWLVVHFEGLRTVESAHRGASGLPVLLGALTPAGVAVLEFLFAPSTAAPDATASAVTSSPAPFNPSTATLWQHVHYNAWGWYSSRQKELIRRTALLAGLMFAETLLASWATVAGVELLGAVGYAGIWALGALVTGGVLDWVGGPSD